MFILASDLDCSKILPVLDIAKFALTVIQWVAPILLILWGSIDLIKSIIAGKEEDVKKNQKVLIKRAISGLLIFLIPMFVTLILGLVGTTDWRNCWNSAKASIATTESDYDERVEEINKNK